MPALSVSKTKKSFDKFKEKCENLTKEAKDESNEEGKEHVADLENNRGVFSRGGSYAKYGFHYIKKKRNRRKVYDASPGELKPRLESRFTVAKGTAVGSAEHISRYRFHYIRRTGAGPQYNFHNQNMPYRCQAHHIIPCEVFSAKKNRFTESQLALLKKVPYNINHGENIIFLPKTLINCKIHRLPSHCGSHPKYNKLVADDVKKLKNHLNKKKEQKCKDNDFPVIKILNELILSQDKFWDWHVIEEGKGDMSVNDHAALKSKRMGKK